MTEGLTLFFQPFLNEKAPWKVSWSVAFLRFGDFAPGVAMVVFLTRLNIFLGEKGMFQCIYTTTRFK